MANTSNAEAKKFTKDCVIEALFKLIEEKEYEKISLTEIAEKAGVSRNAIYRNFESKDMILKTYIHDISRDIAIKFTEKNIKGYNDYIYFLIENLYMHREICKKLYDAKLQIVLLDAFMMIKGRFEVDKYIKDYYENYRIGAFFSVYLTWLENGCKETPDELFAILSRIMKMNGLVPVLPKIKGSL